MRMKASWLVSVLLLLSAITMIATANTSAYVSPASFTFLPSFTFTFATATSSTHIFTFHPSFTFIFPTTTGSTPTLPPATAIQETDWTVLGIDAIPPNPQPGDQMVFRMSFAALSSNMPFPQAVYIQCQIDSFSCGAGTVTYSGPVGSPATVTADSYWPATPGPHVLTWFVDTTHDPNPGNNLLSIQFFVQPPQAPTTLIPSTETTQVTVTPPVTQPPSTVIQTSIQTVTQSPTQSSSGLMSTDLQGYTLPLVAIIVILILALAYSMQKRKTKPGGPQTNVWFCTNCGTKNGVNDNFCAKCGTAKPKL